MARRQLSIELDNLECLIQNFEKTLRETGDVTSPLEEHLNAIKNAVKLLNREKPINGIHHSSADKQYNAEQRKKGWLPEKVFVSRPSYLNEMLEIPHLKSLFNLCVAAGFMLCLVVLLACIVQPDRIIDDLMSLKSVMEGWEIGLLIWIALNICIVGLVLPAIYVWSRLRQRICKKIIDLLFLSGLMVVYAAFLVVPAKLVMHYKIAPLASLVLVVEQVRLLMKMHSLAREVIGRILHGSKLNPDSTEFKASQRIPSIKQTLYFMVAPTLIYRDHYPRTAKCDWRCVVSMSVQFFATVGLYYIFFYRFVRDTFRDAGKPNFHVLNLTVTTISMLTVGALTQLMCFYGFFHCWLNAFAEVLQFGDRHFYSTVKLRKDWWNKTTYEEYFRSWNIVVHDWLYTYIHRDLYKVSKNKTVSILSVFFISAVIHEYIFTLTFHFFFPAMFLFFAVFGVLVTYLFRKKEGAIWNVFMWWSLITGLGMLLVFYAIEYYARFNCPKTTDERWDFIIPRSLSASCNTYTFSAWIR